MPEGDSVHRLARRLDRSLLGRTVARSDLRVPRLATRDLAGRTVLEHDTHGKHLLTRFSGDVTLHTHLLMDGSWTLTRPGRRLPTRLMARRPRSSGDHRRLERGDRDLVLEAGEVVEFDTRTPHWIGNPGPHPAEALALFGPQGERMHVRSRTS